MLEQVFVLINQKKKKVLKQSFGVLSQLIDFCFHKPQYESNSDNKNILIQLGKVIFLHTKSETKAVSGTPVNFKSSTISRNQNMHGKEVTLVFFLLSAVLFCNSCQQVV